MFSFVIFAGFAREETILTKVIIKAFQAFVSEIDQGIYINRNDTVFVECIIPFP